MMCVGLLATLLRAQLRVCSTASVQLCACLLTNLLACSHSPFLLHRQPT
jgi:hypothetical protein